MTLTNAPGMNVSVYCCANLQIQKNIINYANIFYTTPTVAVLCGILHVISNNQLTMREYLRTGTI